MIAGLRGVIQRIMDGSIVISDIHSKGQKEALDLLSRISRLEKKTFPSSETFDFSVDLWKKKPNTRVIYVSIAENTSAHAALVAYAVYVRMKGVALLHKICVAAPFRCQGIGAKLMDYVLQRLRREGCQSIQLWVDRERDHARRLYSRCGFEEREQIDNYYGSGRTGIKMVQDLQVGR
jgi:ribosomal protein S18 acetylase RimI-like enzyme